MSGIHLTFPFLPATGKEVDLRTGRNNRARDTGTGEVKSQGGSDSSRALPDAPLSLFPQLDP